ncbi:MAG: precorrin-3B synthase, partial [Hyphomicrobium sp.]
MSGPEVRGPAVRGWCPGALRPMPSGDGLVVRIRPAGGRLSPQQADGVAKLAEALGNGLIDLTSRANVQLRGITAESHRPLVEGLRRLGLVDASPEDEARRNIVVSPFARDHDGTETIATALAAALASPDAPDLPGKFGFAVDCGNWPVLRDTPADIRIERSATGELSVCADGAGTGAPAAVASAASIAIGLARWF